MRVTELPLNGRNPFALTNLSTGVDLRRQSAVHPPLRQRRQRELLDQRRPAADQLVAARRRAGRRDHGHRRAAHPRATRTSPTSRLSTRPRSSRSSPTSTTRSTGAPAAALSTSPPRAARTASTALAYEFLRRYQLDANSIQNNANNRPRYGVDPITEGKSRRPQARSVRHAVHRPGLDPEGVQRQATRRSSPSASKTTSRARPRPSPDLGALAGGTQRRFLRAAGHDLRSVDHAASIRTSIRRSRAAPRTRSTSAIRFPAT